MRDLIDRETLLAEIRDKLEAAERLQKEQFSEEAEIRYSGIIGILYEVILTIKDLPAVVSQGYIVESPEIVLHCNEKANAEMIAKILEFDADNKIYPDRLKYVREAISNILHHCNTNSNVDKAFRNSARLIQNALDGEYVEFEKIDEEEKCNFTPCQPEIKKVDPEKLKREIRGTVLEDWQKVLIETIIDEVAGNE